jgi:hypothetical protein
MNSSEYAKPKEVFDILRLLRYNKGVNDALKQKHLPSHSAPIAGGSTKSGQGQLRLDQVGWSLSIAQPFAPPFLIEAQRAARGTLLTPIMTAISVEMLMASQWPSSVTHRTTCLQVICSSTYQ